MSTKAIRNILLRFREKCGSEAEMLPGERAAYRGALAEVEAIEEAAQERDEWRHMAERLHRDAPPASRVSDESEAARWEEAKGALYALRAKAR